MVNRIRRRLQNRLRSITPTSTDQRALWDAYDALALELRDLNATTTNGYRAAIDSIRAELDHGLERTEVKRAAFEEHVRIWVPESIDALREHVEAHTNDAVDASTDALRTRLRRLERSVAATPPVAPPSRESTAPPTGPTASEVPTSDGSTAPNPTDSLFGLNYSAFEDELRGTPDHVKQLELVHVDTILGFDAPELPVLDIGCGRGELLQLLGERGIAARGIDLNAVSVAECVADGLDVVQGDALAYLRSLPAGSLRAVCGLHLVEHLTDTDRTALIIAAYEALAVGGGIILETPNPENLRVGATTFWLDPTHLRPVPPRLLEFQVSEAGFDSVEVQRLHPSDDAVVVPADADPLATDLAALVNRLIAGPMDYAVIGRKVES